MISNLRRRFGKFSVKEEVKNVESSTIHTDSYEYFLQANKEPNKRENHGLERLLRTFFPIYLYGVKRPKEELALKDQKTNIVIEYISYSVIEPSLSLKFCKKRGETYSCTLRVKVLIKNLTDNITKEYSGFIGEIPMITPSGTFVINGHERIFMLQLQRCPGVLFLRNIDSISLKPTCTAKVYPHIGAWLFITYENGIIYLSIDKKKKMPITTFLLCFPKIFENKISIETMTNTYSAEEILDSFYKKITIYKNGEFWNMEFNWKNHTHFPFSIYINNELVGVTGELINELPTTIEIKLNGHFLAEDLSHINKSLIIGTKITSENIQYLQDLNEIKIFQIDKHHMPYILNTWNLGAITNRMQAIRSWALHMRISAHFSVAELTEKFFEKFFDYRYYDLDNVGRHRLNSVLGLNFKTMHLHFTDIVETTKQLIELVEDRRPSDDMDNLEHKWVKTVGNTLENYFRLGIIKFEKNLKDRISLLDWHNFHNISDVFNFRLMINSIKDCFFLSSQLSDSVNRLNCEIQKRKLKHGSTSNKERVPENVRSIQPSVFNKICPIQTSEGQMIGLLLHLALCAIIDIITGFIVSHYYDSKTMEIVTLNTSQEKNKVISNIENYDWVLKETNDGKEEYLLVPKAEQIMCYKNGEYSFHYANEVDFITLTRNSLYSVGLAIAPFIGNNSMERIMIGSNMGQQGITPWKNEAPFIGTGIEKHLAERIVAENDGIVLSVDQSYIIIAPDNGQLLEIHELIFNEKTNADTAICNSPRVNVGDKVKKGQLIADGFSTKNGELACGKNLVVAFISGGKVYDDGIQVSREVIDSYSFMFYKLSSHRCHVTDNRLGLDKLTNDVKGGATAVDEFGIPAIGTLIKNQDQVIVGKTSNQVQDNSNPEQNLLQYVFTDKKQQDVDTSYRAGPDEINSYVINVNIMSRRSSVAIDPEKLQYTAAIKKLHDSYNKTIACLDDSLVLRIKNLSTNLELKKLQKDPHSLRGEEKYKTIFEQYDLQKAYLHKQLLSNIDMLNTDCVLPDNTNKIIDVTLAKIFRGEVGDKLCGRYGNKGVIAAILPRADMPYTKDGIIVDVVMNVLSIMSRMNLGQLYETTLGYALLVLRNNLKNLLLRYNLRKNPNLVKYCSEERLEQLIGVDEELEEIRRLVDLAANDLSKYGFTKKVNELEEEELISLARHFVENGIYLQVEQFYNLSQKDIEEFLVSVGAEADGKVDLYDGRTGEKLYAKVLVGYQYILKLYHLAEFKMTARATGPISIKTKQPTTGKENKGGQKIGEMEFWCIDALGAAVFKREKSGPGSDSVEEKKKLFVNLLHGLHYSMVFNQPQKKPQLLDSFWNIVRYFNCVGFDLKIEKTERLT